MSKFRIGSICFVQAVTAKDIYNVKTSSSSSSFFSSVITMTMRLTIIAVSMRCHNVKTKLRQMAKGDDPVQAVTELFKAVPGSLSNSSIMTTAS